MSERILVVDDDTRVLQGYQRALRKRFRLDTAPGGWEALDLLARHGPYAVIVSDMKMPDMDGMRLLEQVRDSYPATVRIMLTGNSDQQTAVDAVNRGQIFRFLNKPCTPEAMGNALQEGLDQYSSSREKEAQLEKSTAEARALAGKLRYQSRHDLLTGLPNREAFEARLETALVSARGEGREHAFCYIDLDHLHLINNACGTAAGDKALRQVARVISSLGRRGDLCARLKGDEFGILLGDCSLDEAEKFVESLRVSLKEYRFHWGSEYFEISASIGLVGIDTKSGEATALFNAAEAACRLAKDKGRNALQISDVHDHNLAVYLDEPQWVGRIQRALEEGYFRLFQQPIQPLDPTAETGDHYELLIRLQDDDGGVVPPGAFLPVAEHYHLSPRIDRWVIEAAIEWFVQHPGCLQRLAVCSINLSGHSLGNSEMQQFIQSAFEKSELPSEKFCFEVTETAAISQLGKAIDFIGELKKKGFLFSLDDFGSGLSSFAYLKNLPVDFLKIDGVFVKNMHRDPVDYATVRAINEIGHAMGKKTIAEYVENELIHDQLRQLGVDYSQGYLISRPRPIEQTDPLS